MIIESRPWENVVVQHPGGGWSCQRADAETIKRQLEEYKKKRISELQEEIRKIESLF